MSFKTPLTRIFVASRVKHAHLKKFANLVYKHAYFHISRSEVMYICKSGTHIHHTKLKKKKHFFNLENTDCLIYSNLSERTWKIEKKHFYIVVTGSPSQHWSLHEFLQGQQKKKQTKKNKTEYLFSTTPLLVSK